MNTANKKNAIAREAAGVAGSKAETATTEAKRLPRVLVCDDYVNTCRIVKKSLRNRCFVESAATEDELLAKADGHDSYLIDISLNGEKSGVRLMQQLRRDPANEHSRFIAFTAHDQPAQVEAYREQGFDEVLAKPFELNDLYRVLGVER